MLTNKSAEQDTEDLTSKSRVPQIAFTCLVVVAIGYALVSVWQAAYLTRVFPVGVGLITLSLIGIRSEEHTSELQSLMRISYAVFCLKKKNITTTHNYM